MTWTYTDLVNKEPGAAKKQKIRQCILFQDAGLSDAEIADRIGYKNVISVSGLRQTKWFHQEAQRLAPKLKNPVGKKVQRMTADDHNRIRELHSQGLNHEEIAAAMPEWADSTIQRNIKKLGLRPPRKARLSDDEKAEIIRLREQEEMSHKQIGIEIGRPESTISAFCLKYFGYTRPDLIKNKQNGAKASHHMSVSPHDSDCRRAHASDDRDRMTFAAPPEVAENGTPKEHHKQSFHFRSGIAFLPSPRRSPQEITHEVRQSLLKHPTFCDTWHAGECDVLETLVARIRYRMGIPNMRELKRNTL